MSKGIFVKSFLLHSQRQVFSISVFSMDHEMRHLINLFTLYKSSIEHNIELPANDMAAKTEKL